MNTLQEWKKQSKNQHQSPIFLLITLIIILKDTPSPPVAESYYYKEDKTELTDLLSSQAEWNDVPNNQRHQNIDWNPNFGVLLNLRRLNKLAYASRIIERNILTHYNSYDNPGLACSIE